MQKTGNAGFSIRFSTDPPADPDIFATTDNIKFHTFTGHLLWYVCFFRPF